MSDTFYLSNMSPQNPSFNRGVWKKLENRVRTWSLENDEIYVVTGPVLADGPFDTIGKNNVSIPKRFYKVILDYKEPEIKAIAFILPNERSTEALSNFALTINEVEHKPFHYTNAKPVRFLISLNPGRRNILVFEESPNIRGSPSHR